MNRFALTAAGIATVSMAGSAMAETVNGFNGLDRWFGEHSWTIADSSGAVVASMAAGAYTGVSNFSFVSFTSDTAHAYDVTFTMDLAAGDYDVVMNDSYGDGWQWNSYIGGLYVSGSAVSGGSAGASFPSSAGNGPVSWSFTVIPAPGAMALLGLAGLAGRRRRRA